MRFKIGKDRYFAAGVFCGERWYHLRSWMVWPFIRGLKPDKGFSFGPFLFWID